MKELCQTEELSRAIDSLNNQKPHNTRYSEVNQLVNTAAYVKQYAQSAKDTAIINQLTHRISEDIAARRRRKRWLSAIGSVAAAAFLYANVSLPTQTDTANFQPNPAPEAPRVAAVEAVRTPADAVTEPTANLTKTRSLDDSKVKEPSRSSQPITKKQNSSDQPSHQMITAKDANPASVLMVLPDRFADTISNKDGIVKQVYGQNTEKEIVITQRAALSAAKAETPAEPAAEMPAAAVMKSKSEPILNKTIRNVNGVEVVVEGKQPQAELEQVAASLVPSVQSNTKQDSNDKQEKKE